MEEKEVIIGGQLYSLPQLKIYTTAEACMM